MADYLAGRDAPETVNLSRVRSAVDASLDLLERSYLRVDADLGGGWYHELAGPLPGPTATAVGLLSFRMHGRTFEQSDDCLRFLRWRQVSSSVPERRGGWATNSSPGHSVAESTGWIVRMLAEGRYFADPSAPDLTPATEWLVLNQNDDGGWGSLLGNPSRVWTTGLSLRALIRVDPAAATVNRGVRWLVQHQHPEGGWGQTGVRAPSVTHSAMALISLVESGRSEADEAIRRGFAWLETRVERTFEEDRNARVEMYDVVAGTGDDVQRWRNTLPHYGLPYALSALLMNPAGAHAELIAGAVNTLLRTQLSEGRWPSVEGGETASIWSVFPHMEALVQLIGWRPLGSEDTLMLLPDAVIVYRGGAHVRTLAELARMQRRKAIGRVLSRHWVSLLLVLTTVLGLVGVLVGRFDWKDFGLSVALPIALLVLQEARHRTRPVGGGDGRGR